jgi:hypothetical protein
VNHTAGREHAHRRRRAVDLALSPMVVVAIVPVAAAVVAAASPTIIDGDEDAARQELHTDEGEKEGSDEGDGQAWHDSSPPWRIGNSAYSTFDPDAHA